MYEISSREDKCCMIIVNVESNNNHEEQNIHTENRLVVSRRGVWVAANMGEVG